jgi:hypothetical protein
VDSTPLRYTVMMPPLFAPLYVVTCGSTRAIAAAHDGNVVNTEDVDAGSLSVPTCRHASCQHAPCGATCSELGGSPSSPHPGFEPTAGRSTGEAVWAHIFAVDSSCHDLQNPRITTQRHSPSMALERSRCPAHWWGKYYVRTCSIRQPTTRSHPHTYTHTYTDVSSFCNPTRVRPASIVYCIRTQL